MNLTDALSAVAPAVGDGKFTALHAYVKSERNQLHATDGRQWAVVPLDMDNTGRLQSVVSFCVRYEALKRAMERDGMTSMASDGAHGLKLAYGRGRASLKGVDPALFPSLADTAGDATRIEATYSLPPDFSGRVKDLLAFCSGSDGHIWQQAVHVQPDYLFAANSFALAKWSAQWGFNTAVGIPAWACKFIVSQDGCPLEIRDRGPVISFVWPNGTELFTALLTQEPPENIVSFASNLVEPNALVPEGLKDSISRLSSYGAKTCRIGANAISYLTEEIELEDEVEIVGPPRTWSIETLSAALEHATKLSLSESNATWSGSGYVGVFGGRSD